jgi:hypothetical protein
MEPLADSLDVTMTIIAIREGHVVVELSKTYPDTGETRSTTYDLTEGENMRIFLIADDEVV